MNKKILIWGVVVIVVLGGVYMAMRSSHDESKMMETNTMVKDATIKEGEAMELKMKEEAAPAMPHDGAMMQEDGAMMMKH